MGRRFLKNTKIQTYFLVSLILLITLFLKASVSVNAQKNGDEFDEAKKIFNLLTPHERVGQLFMVSFQGKEITAESNIGRLIQQYRIGGVYLSAENENFSNEQDTPTQVLTLTHALQTMAVESPPPAIPTNKNSKPLTSTFTSPVPSSKLGEKNPFVGGNTPIPLLIAITHEGDGFPYTQIRNGLTEIPNEMAIGATWNSKNAEAIGQVVGQELSLLGINTLFGPSLDVLDNPRPERDGSLGTRTFGGDPYWVAELGQAYIRGVHSGSNQKMLTIAKNFPGFGSSDREINQGLPTILKSLDDLQRIELVPFFKVTNVSSKALTDTMGQTDGLMTAHIRYQGLQGNAPISLDARNLPTLLALKEIVPWREVGGLIVSAPLGAPAALEGSSSKESFPARRLVQDALFAGSDILFLANFAFNDNPSAQFRNIADAIEFFQDKYSQDTNFQAIVNKAVWRVLKAKIKIYGPDLLVAEVKQPPKNLALLKSSPLDLAQIVQAGVTLITPSTQPGFNPLAAPPKPGDNILIITDDRLAQDCKNCPSFPLIPKTALQNIILQLFGPKSTGQVSADHINSLSFVDLKKTLSDKPLDNVEQAIKKADWLIFLMLNVDTKNQPQSDAVRLLLRNRYDTLRNKKLLLFAFNAPYFLDETEISQLTAYYCFYSRGSQYLEAAARLLFQQFEPKGASPVGIPAIGPLDLSPDPKQNIQLEPIQKIDVNGRTISLEKKDKVDLKIKESVLLHTSVILDRNGHPVPDGTSVNIFRGYPDEGFNLEPLTAKTIHGVAEILIRKDRDAYLRVSVSSNLAVGLGGFDIGPGSPINTPTATITPLPSPSPTPTFTQTPLPPTATLTVTPTPTPYPTMLPLPVKSVTRSITWIDLIFSFVGIMIVGLLGFFGGGARFLLEERIRPFLISLAFGLAGYIFYGFITYWAFPETGYQRIIIEEGIKNHWLAPIISTMGSAIAVIIWFLKPGRLFELKLIAPTFQRIEKAIDFLGKK